MVRTKTEAAYWLYHTYIVSKKYKTMDLNRVTTILFEEVYPYVGPATTEKLDKVLVEDLGGFTQVEVDRMYDLYVKSGKPYKYMERSRLKLLLLKLMPYLKPIRKKRVQDVIKQL